jgi:multiple sugar transport system ATP-binding protein
VTTLHVTHDQEEAMAVADRIVVLRAGRICQIAAPMQLYRQPADVFVAGFVGAPAMNLWQGWVRGHGDAAVFELSGIVGAEGIRVRLPRGCGPAFAVGRDREAKVVLGLRPEALRLVSADPESGEGAEVVGKVVRVERLGADTILHFTVGTNGGTLRCAGDFAARDGEEVRLGLDFNQAHWFDAASGVRLADRSR